MRIVTLRSPPNIILREPAFASLSIKKAKDEAAFAAPTLLPFTIFSKPLYAAFRPTDRTRKRFI